VTPLDLRAEPRPEPGLHGQHNAVLRRKRARQIGAGDEAELDDRFAEPFARSLLHSEGALELVVVKEALLDKKAPQGTPGDAGRFHTIGIGPILLGGKRFRSRMPRSSEAETKMRSTLPMFPPADANLAYQVGAVPNVSG
jgi:hypothetical protein